MNATLLVITIWLVTVPCVTVTRSPLEILKRQGSVCIKAVDYNETMADFHRHHSPSDFPGRFDVERFIGKELADDDRIIRFENDQYHGGLRVMFVNVVEKKNGKSHFVRLYQEEGSSKQYPYMCKTINENEFEKWRAACINLSGTPYPKPPHCFKDFEKSETMAEFRNFANASNEVERLLSKKLAANDSIKRYEIRIPKWPKVWFLRKKYSLPDDDWGVMFLKVTEKATGKNHFIRVDRPRRRWTADKSSEEEYKRSGTACSM